LVLTEDLLDLLTAAADDGAVICFRSVRRDKVQGADDFHKFVDRMDFSLHSRWLNAKHILSMGYRSLISFLVGC